MNKMSKYLFLLSLSVISLRETADVDFFDVPGQPGSCRVVVEYKKHTIEWFGSCEDAESKAIDFFVQKYEKID